MSALELKIPPPLVAAAVAGCMYAAAVLLPAPVLALPPGVRVGMALALAAVGAGFDVAGLWAFRKARTTVNPLTPHRSVAVVSTGVYRFTRNPMYLGLLLTLLGVAAWLAHPLALLCAAAFVVALTHLQIKPEERILKALFGALYEDYVRRVRRWL